MNSIPFLILGFTGPIGSGCTTLADIIARTSISARVKREGLYEKNEEEFNKISKNMVQIKTDLKNYDNQLVEHNIDMYNEQLEYLNKKLKTCYEKRVCLDIIKKIEDPKFVYISMSAFILMLTVKTMDSIAYIELSNQCPKLAHILQKFKDDFIDTIDLYNKNEKRYGELTIEELSKIDVMFKSLNETNKHISDIEIEEYFSSSLNELHMQTFGNNLRRTGNAFSNNNLESSLGNITIIANEVNKYIKYYRNRKDNKNSNCFVVDAFRNPAEVEFFRRYSQFFLISLYANEKIREERFQNKFFKGKTNNNFGSKFKNIDKRDWGDDSNIDELYMQNVSRCYFMADISMNNDRTSLKFDVDLFKKFVRYYALIVSPGCIQPTREETFMNLAYSLSLRSSCISRKVGAVITDKKGYVLGMGWNEVAHGQIGCGLRLKEDYLNKNKLFSMDIFREMISEKELEQYTDSDSICFKDVFSEKKIREKLSKTSLPESYITEVLKVLKVKRLEYCRSLHAEENALLQVASRGGMGVNEGEIYTTTFPCELCAKKIYQSGIKRIYFTEPYPNGISKNVFLVDGIRYIETRSFEGVKSFSYFKLFKPSYDKKEAQKIDDL